MRSEIRVKPRVIDGESASGTSPLAARKTGHETLHLIRLPLAMATFRADNPAAFAAEDSSANHTAFAAYTDAVRADRATASQRDYAVRFMNAAYRDAMANFHADDPAFAAARAARAAVPDDRVIRFAKFAAIADWVKFLIDIANQ